MFNIEKFVTKPQTITIASMANPEWEAQGVFVDGKLIDAWSQNDASWPGEYFNDFMKQLGIIVIEKEADENEERAINKCFGL